MPSYTKISIFVKDASNHVDYNRRIIEYLNDRHTALNDNGYTIAIDVIDDDNINEHILNGMESIPTMRVGKDDDYIYGVNSILSALAKLEIIQNPSQAESHSAKKKDTGHGPAWSAGAKQSDEDNAFHSLALQEMQSDQQEDPDAPTTLRAYGQDLPEAVMSEKSIEEKMSQYTKIYEDRRRQSNGKGSKHRPPPPKKPVAPLTTGVNIDKLISSGTYDKGEEMLMRQIAQNL